MQKVKERLFGITVVVSLSVIFVPMLLTGNDDNRLNLAQSIPATPDAQPSKLAYAQHAHYLTTDSGAVTDHDLYSQAPEAQDYNPNSLSSDKKTTLSDQISSVKAKVTSKPLVAETTNSINVAKKVKAKVINTASASNALNFSNERNQQNQRVQSTAVQQVHESWVVRLATFGNPQNAENLAVRLKQDGYNAYTQASKRVDKNYTYVLVGVGVDVNSNDKKQPLQKLSNDLQAKYNLRGMVVANQPDSRS